MTTSSPAPSAAVLPFSHSPHLVSLVAECEHLAARLEETAPGEGHAALWSDAAIASLRLDGSTITAPPTRQQVHRAMDDGGTAVATRATGSWEATLRSARDVEEAEDEVLWAREFQGVVTALSSDDLAESLLRDPVDALAELHRRLTAGLVARDVAGRPRQTHQAVHDGSLGRILWYAPDPAEVPGELHRLAGWLASAAAREHGLVVSGVVHRELLRLHPFEAANGRLARAAARLVLRARGLDSHGLAAAEIPLADDALGIHEEVVRTTRRRDLTIWLERWGEAVTAGLRHAALALGVEAPPVPGRAADVLAAHDDFTIMDYRAEASVGPEAARADLTALLDAGMVHRVPGTRGLRFRVGAPTDVP